MRTRGEKRVLSFRIPVANSEAEGLLADLRRDNPELILQLVTLRGEPNARVIELIGTQTAEALRSRALLAEKPEVDLLLRIAGTTQIAEALKLVGYVRSGKKVLVAIGEPKPLSLLQRRARQSPSKFRALKQSQLTGGDLKFVETAALLGAMRRY